MVVGSQYGEDGFLQEFFKDKPYGFLVDVGAADGKDNSNSFYLLQRPQWQGVLIEPEPKQYQVLRERYADKPDVFCINCGVREKEGFGILYCAAQVSTFLPSWRDRCIEVHGLTYGETTVKMMPLTTILQVLQAPAEIDFLSIDCEGMDMVVLHSLDFTFFHPRLICMEGKGNIIPGYQKVHETLGNVFYKEVPRGAHL